MPRFVGRSAPGPRPRAKRSPGEDDPPGYTAPLCSTRQQMPSAGRGATSCSPARATTTPGISRALCASLGWRADVLNWDQNRSSDLYYHGQDYRLEGYGGPHTLLRHLAFYLLAIRSLRHLPLQQRARDQVLGPCCTTTSRERFSPGRGDPPAEATREEDRLLEQRLPRRRVPELASRHGATGPCATDCPWRDAPGRLQRRAQPRLGALPQQPAPTSRSRCGGNRDRLQRRPAGPRGAGVLLPRSRGVAARSAESLIASGWTSRGRR